MLIDKQPQKGAFVHMANSTTQTATPKELKIYENGGWTAKTVVVNTIGELRVELDIPDEVQVNISDTLYTDNTATMPTNETNEDGSIKPLFVGWQSNNKTGGVINK